MSQFDDDDSKPWTEHDLKEAIRRINAGEINFKEAEDYYGISPRTIHRQRAIENMRAQLNPEKTKKAKSNPPSSTKKDVTVLRKPVDTSCSSISDVATLLDTGTEEVKQLLNYECDMIYECKICKNLFRSLVNFISHKRVYCCDMYSVLYSRKDDGENGIETNESKAEDKIKSKENVKEFTAKPFRITCRKDLTSVLKRITAVTEYAPSEPVLKIEHIESTSNAYQQTLVNRRPSNTNESSKSTTEQPVENTETSSEAEPKPETTVSVSKIPEKQTVSEKSSSYVAEKRFRCPVCASNFTIKKSVMRHLKAVHNQSLEQIERLKPRIQMHYVRKKSNTVENKSPPAEEKSSPAANNSKAENVNPNQNKAEWEKWCVLCDRYFTNRNSYAAHTRSCRRHAASQESDVESPRPGTSSKKSLQPVVSLTPLASPAAKFKKAVDTTSTKSTALQPNSANKKPTTAASAPSGILVRMNYSKANANTTTSTSITSSAPTPTYPSTPVSVVTSSSSTQSSANNSRRSSYAAPTAKNDDLVNGHHNAVTRSSSNSGAVLANILETLLGRAKEQTTTETATTASSKAITTSAPTVTTRAHLPPSSEESVVTAGKERRKLPKNKVSVYCEDCRTSYVLEEYKCGSVGGSSSSSNNGGRSFRCALRSCDFKCNDKRQLLPHLNAKHAVMLEGELAAVQSTFIAESSGVQNECCCNAQKKKNASGDDKTDERGVGVARKAASLPTSNNIASASEGGATSKSQPPKLQQQPQTQPIKAPPPLQQRSAPALKRKLTLAVPAAKRKPLNVKQSSIGDNEPLQQLKMEPGWGDPATSAGEVAPPTLKRENSAVEEVNASINQLVLTRKTKKLPTISAAATYVTPKKSSPTAPTDGKLKLFPRIKIKQTPEKPLVNGVGVTAASSSSSDEENDLPEAAAAAAAATAQQTANVKPKMNCGVLRKQNAAASPAVDVKPTKSPTIPDKVANCVNEFSSSSSTPDSDLDPSTLTEENLKKSIMTIIFGKDMPADKLEDREKSPTSSSTSSDGGKEKRYSIRIAKQSTTTKSVAPSPVVVDGSSKEDKVTKIPITNKVKATTTR